MSTSLCCSTWNFDSGWPNCWRVFRYSTVACVTGESSIQMCLQELGGCRRFIIELGYTSVTLRIVIIRIDYDLARKRLDWNGLVRF